jgi:glycosyltransferase involved in cell wall biosynthesis
MIAQHDAAAGSPITILIEVNSADLRMGAANDALDLAELARPAGATFVICGPLTDAFRAEAERRGATTFVAASRTFSRSSLPLYAADVLRWMVRLQRLRPDVVHLNYPGYGPSLACAARLCGVPIVSRPGPFVAGNLSNRWVAAYVANCRAHASGLLDSPLADRVVIAGDLFRPGRLQATMTTGRPLPVKHAGVPRILFLGQLVERKGLHVLVDAFARLDVPAELVLAGGDWSDPGYPQRITQLARERGVADRILFENHREDVGALLSTADIFALPSLSDARPRSIIEAMSLGIPVVASDTGGIPSLIVSGETGVLVPPDDAPALSAALHRLVVDAGLRRSLGDAARSSAAENFRADRTAEEYVRLYRRLARQTRSANAGFPVPA